MLKAVLFIEGKGIFVRRNILIIAAVFLLLSGFVWDGINDYKLVQDNIEPFQKTENDKVSRHIHYTFYGVRGVRILYIPDLLSVIFNDSGVFSGMNAHVDSAEKLSITNSMISKDLFSNSGGYMDFSGILLILGPFLGLLYGHIGTRKKEYLKMVTDLSGCRNPAFLITVARAILLNLFFWILAGLNLLLLLICGLDAANIFYLCFVLVFTLVITFFVFSGAYIGRWKTKAAQWIALPVLYFLMVFILPWFVQKMVYIDAKNGLQSVYGFEHETYKYIMQFEERFYNKFNIWKSGNIAPEDVKETIQDGQQVEYKKIRQMEEERIADIMKRIRTYQTIAAFFPTTFYQSFNKEISGKGFQNFIDFFRYTFDMKNHFTDFYIERKFYRSLPEEGVESFIKNNENLYYGKSQFPPTFLLGILVLLFYIGLPIFFMYRLRDKDPAKEIKEPLIVFDVKQTAMIVLCKDDSIKTHIFRYYQTLDTAACIDQYPDNFKQNGYSAKTVLRYFSRLAGVNIELAEKHLAMLGIEGLDKNSLSPEDILKIYAAVKISGDSVKYVVFNDFFKMKSRQFENDFRSLISQLEEQDIKIIYLSCDMPYPKTPMREIIKVERFETYPLDFENVTLR